MDGSSGKLHTKMEIQQRPGGLSPCYLSKLLTGQKVLSDRAGKSTEEPPSENEIAIGTL
jgi:hypothetical protein